MKQLPFLLVAFFAIQIISAQEKNLALEKSIDENAIYNTSFIEVKPQFPGGLQEFYNYIGKKYKTPNVKGLKGRILVTFVIEKDGSVTDIKVIEDIGYGTGEEAIRVLKKCKKWIPAEQNGKKVRVQYSLPINIEAN